MRVSSIVAASATLAAASFVQAQHSYLPAQDATGKIHTFVDPDGSDDPIPFIPDRLVSNVFDRFFDANDPTAQPSLDPNAARAGGPSAFAKPTGDAAFNDIPGFSPLPGNSDLMITNPVLSDPHFNASGNLLYWDGSGNTPNFGAVPAGVKIDILRQDGDAVALKASLDGGMTPVTWTEDTLTPEGDRSGHFHMRYDVVGDNGGNSFEAPDGIYLLGHSVGVLGLTDSDTVAVPLMLNRGGSGDLANALLSSIGFLENNVVPEPTTGLILAVGGGLVLSIRRRKASA